MKSPNNSRLFHSTTSAAAADGSEWCSGLLISETCVARSHRLRKSESGNVYTEAAFVLVPFFALLLGIVDFGMAISIRSTIQSAVTSGVQSFKAGLDRDWIERLHRSPGSRACC